MKYFWRCYMKICTVSWMHRCFEPVPNAERRKFLISSVWLSRAGNNLMLEKFERRLSFVACCTNAYHVVEAHGIWHKTSGSQVSWRNVQTYERERELAVRPPAAALLCEADILEIRGFLAYIIGRKRRIYTKKEKLKSKGQRNGVRWRGRRRKKRKYMSAWTNRGATFSHRARVAASQDPSYTLPGIHPLLFCITTTFSPTSHGEYRSLPRSLLSDLKNRESVSIHRVIFFSLLQQTLSVWINFFFPSSFGCSYRTIMYSVTLIQSASFWITNRCTEKKLMLVKRRSFSKQDEDANKFCGFGRMEGMRGPRKISHWPFLGNIFRTSKLCAREHSGWPSPQSQPSSSSSSRFLGQIKPEELYVHRSVCRTTKKRIVKILRLYNFCGWLSPSTIFY